MLGLNPAEIWYRQIFQSGCETKHAVDSLNVAYGYLEMREQNKSIVPDSEFSYKLKGVHVQDNVLLFFEVLHLQSRN